jgi:hypothetical protein
MKGFLYFLAILFWMVGIIGGLAFAAWLGGYVMLYGGIVGAIQSATATAMVGNILKAIFCRAGMLAGGLIGTAFCLAGAKLWKVAKEY